MRTIDKLQSLYQQLDLNVCAGEDVVADVRKEINNLELSYIKDEVLPKIIGLLGDKIKWMRCELDCSIQFNEDKQINYSFCKSGSTLMIKDSVLADECRKMSFNYIDNPDNVTIEKNKVEKIEYHTSEDSVKKLQDNDRMLSISSSSTMTEEDWLRQLKEMKCMPYRNFKVPHKAIFILSIIECIQHKFIRDNRIYPTLTIIGIFNKLWKKHVHSNMPFNQNFYQPYVHLSSEPFYDLVRQSERAKFDINLNWSQYQANKYFKYGVLNENFFNLLKNPDFCKRVKTVLIDTFISQTEKSNDTIINNLSIQSYAANELDGFKHYLSNKLSKNGKPFSPSSIKVYLGALKHNYIKNLITAASSDCRLNNIPIEELEQFNEKIKNSVRHGEVSNLVATAFSLYISYRNSLNNDRGKYEQVEQSLINEERSSKSSYIKIKSISAEHIHITQGNPTSMIVQFVNQIGPDLVAEMRIRYLGGFLVSKTPNPKYVNASKKLIDDFWINTNSSTKTKIEQIKLICSNLGIDVSVVLDNEIEKPAQEDSISHKNNELSTKSEPHTMYSLNGQLPLNKRQSVLSSVRLFMSLNPDVPFEVIERNFPPELQGSYGVVAKLSKVHSRISQGYDDNNRYFINKSQILKTKDGVEFVVCHQWGNQFYRFQEHVRKRFGWTLKEVE